MNPLLLFGSLEDGPARQALAHNGLASHAQEWSREWHRAQACAWLHATPTLPHVLDQPRALLAKGIEGLGAVAADPRSQMHSSATVPIVLPRAECHRATAGADASASSQAGPSRMAHALPPDDGPGEDALARSWRLTQRDAPSAREATQRRPPPAQVPSPDKDTVRLHIEEAVDGLHVWIGADGEGVAVPGRAAAIVAELRRSERVHSTTVASIVVNGRNLYANGIRLVTPVETSR